MNYKTNPITVWTAAESVTISPSETAPAKITQYAAATLSKRDVQSIIAGFTSESYEMVSAFVWTKTAAALKKQVATLGMEFVGEMLGRPDLNDDSDPATSIADHEAIALAEDLAMITTTQSLRLKHALQLVSHFANLEKAEADEEAMQQDEAISILKACTSSILSQPQLLAANQFADFRKALSGRKLSAEDPDVQLFATSPYFFIRTALSVLLSLVKGAKGATFEHAMGNTIVLIPLVWKRLTGAEKWQIGQAYAEVNSAGNRIASAGLKKALLEVHGFDFVPESLRSSAFTEAAARVLAAHFAYNNFFNEEEPMSALANLGTAIPMPAFAKCMEATLAVWLGNPWGVSRTAIVHADSVLDGLRMGEWEYYLNECLPRDRTVLDKLADDDKPTKRWISLVQKHLIDSPPSLRNKKVSELIAAASGAGGASAIHAKATALRKQITK